MVLLKGKSRGPGRSVDRLDEHFRGRNPRPDQCRALGAQQGRCHRVRRPTGICSATTRARTAATDKATAAGKNKEFRRRRGSAARHADVVRRSAKRDHAGLQSARRRDCAGHVRAPWSTRRRSCPASRSRSASARLQGPAEDNTADSHIAFFLLEKKDEPTRAAARRPTFVGTQREKQCLQGVGLVPATSRSISGRRKRTPASLELNQHVSYIHSKFLLIDPLGKDPIVVTGSANFSKASTNDNDENMIDHPRRSARRGHLFHRVQPAVLPLLLPLGAGEDGEAQRRGKEAAERADAVPGRGRQLGQEIQAAKSLKRKRVDMFKRMDGFAPASAVAIQT